MNMPRTRNLGRYERVIRFIAGVALLGLYGALAAPWRYFTLIGLGFIATGWTGWCPLYTWFDRPSGTGGAGS